VHPLARAPTAKKTVTGQSLELLSTVKKSTPRSVKWKIARVADPADMDADAEHSQAVATAGTQLPAAASGGDIFKVCLNPAVTEGLVDSDCDAFKVRELINCNPENEDSAHAGSHTPPRPGFSMCAHFHVAR